MAIPNLCIFQSVYRPVNLCSLISCLVSSHSLHQDKKKMEDIGGDWNPTVRLVFAHMHAQQTMVTFSQTHPLPLSHPIELPHYCADESQ